MGGERFDNIVKDLFDLDIPGTGFGLGFDRTLEAAEQFNLLPKKATISQVLVTVFSPENLKDSARAAAVLRQANINTEVYPNPQERLGKQLKYANKKNIPWVAIVGPEEVKAGKIALKNMRTKKQEIASIEESVKSIKK